jgi:hypothetical protein
VQHRERAREIGDEDQARLEQSNQDRLAPLVVARDLGAELANARRQLAG